MRIADHQRHAGERCDLGGRALRVASRNENACPRLFSVNSPNHLADFVIRRCGHRASVEHNQVGAGNIRRRVQPLRRKTCFERSSVRLRGATPEILDEESIHLANSNVRSKLPHANGLRFIA